MTFFCVLFFLFSLPYQLRFLIYSLFFWWTFCSIWNDITNWLTPLYLFHHHNQHRHIQIYRHGRHKYRLATHNSIITRIFSVLFIKSFILIICAIIILTYFFFILTVYYNKDYFLYIQIITVCIDWIVLRKVIWIKKEILYS